MITVINEDFFGMKEVKVVYRIRCQELSLGLRKKLDRLQV